MAEKVMDHDKPTYTFDYPKEIETLNTGDICIACYNSMTDGRVNVILKQENLQELLFALEESVLVKL
jgi:hypothetical protein